MSHHVRQPTFPLFGTAYYPEAWPESEWARDLTAIRAAGFTAVRWGEFSWAWWEPEPGRFDFAASDRFVALVGEIGLELILCTPTATPPAWIHSRMPEMLMRDPWGRPHLGNRHYGCFNHPGFLGMCERIIRALTDRYREVPHLVGWQIDNEPNLGEVNQGLLYDYHELTIAAWRRWLQRRYGTIEALNQAWTAVFWSRSTPTFEDIDPPRPGVGMVNHSAWLAWHRFRSENLAHFVHWQRDLLRATSPGISVGTNIPDVNPVAMIQLGQDYWAQAAGLDWAGTDLYAFCKDERKETRQLAYETDLMRSAITAAGARFVIMETQAGPHNVPWRMDFVGGHFGPDYLVRCAELYARHGAEGVCLFLWRPWATSVECGMNGLVDVDGTPTDRSRAVPGIINAARTAMATRKAGRTVHLLYSQASLALAAVMDPEKTPNQAIPGWHALFDGAGWSVAFVDERTVVNVPWTADDVLVLPYNSVMTDGEIASLQRLLAAGGRVVSSWCTGMFDSEGRLVAPRPHGLVAMSGCRHIAADHLSEAHAWRCGDAVITRNVALVEAAAGTTTILITTGGKPVLTRHDGWLGVHVDLGSLLSLDAPGSSELGSLVLTALK